MRVVFAGTPQVALPSLERIHASSDLELVGVLSNPDAKQGRGSAKTRVFTPSPVSAYALKYNIPLLRPDNLHDSEIYDQLAQWDIDAVAVVAYGKLIPPALLQIPTFGWINLHFSLLPYYRGAAPVQYALLSGEKITGASTFFLEAGLDTGAVIGTITQEITPHDTSGTLLNILSHSGAQLLHESLCAVKQKKIYPQPQDNSQASYAPKITTSDARILWNKPSFYIDRLIRAVTPEPGAWTLAAQERIKIAPITLTTIPAHLSPGTVEMQEGKVLVHTKDYCIALNEVQPAGKKYLLAQQWWNNSARQEIVFT